MKPDIVISSQDLDRLEGLLAAPAARNRSDLNGLRDELARADVRDPQDMPADVITMNSRARFRELPGGREHELTLVYPGDVAAEAGKVSVFTPAGSALLGLAVGQTIDWESSDRQPIRIEVLGVTWQPEAAGRFDL
ncbi:nucleoside diphosphate kinase regulator [Aromatoleum petrolei]|uniref:Nucleoside diphosphate kinase regulator n=1 Tax=Aromatoleum petrolei TaxID=76116 RepID=A0ABX1MTV0_9RHOO|nr:nucleoside diphosphate kinase regulator [Aromatoleum petrolei]NMF89760.1 nucleoside diphosphate kinase regulator [Aromatoleum petrolei]QTQ37403.1 Transcription elongation factor, GreA/GreB family [Aromatoleum petrolei]